MNKNQLTNQLLRRRKNPPLAESIPAIEEWFKGDCGRELVEREKSVVDSALERLFGYHLLQLSPCRDLALYENSKIQHCFSLSPLAGGDTGAICNEKELPLESESVDVAVLHHVMDYSEDPHQLLKEVSRVVLPSGYVLVVGFNPFSFFGLRSLLGRFRHQSVFKNHLLSIRRLADWLTLMDFSIQEVQQGFYKPPFDSISKSTFLSKLDALLTRFSFPFGGFYVVLAKKEISRLTPIKQNWRIKPAILPSIEPTMYSPKKNKKTTIH